MIGLGLDPISDVPGAPVCARAGCRSAATWRIEWRNPKIHDAARRKIWLACDVHVEFLREFLAARNFPLLVLTLNAGPSAEPLAVEPRAPRI
jgi:hypothetical protein